MPALRAAIACTAALAMTVLLAAPAAAQYDPGNDADVLGIVEARADTTACITTAIPDRFGSDFTIVATGVGTTDLRTVEASIVSQQGSTLTACTTGFAPGSDVRFFVRDINATGGPGTPLARTGSDTAVLVGVAASAIVIGFGALSWARQRQRRFATPAS